MDNINNLEWDREHLWHPYASMTSPLKTYMVDSAQGTRLYLEGGGQLIDGMSSWWSVIHGYNNAHINKRVREQLSIMSHVMFGGLSHEPAIKLGRMLSELCPDGLDRIFLCDSGSISVEVAMKMALQYWMGKDRFEKKRFFALERGYHGDTWHAMSVSDPTNGMHNIWGGMLREQIFLPQPLSVFGDVLGEIDKYNLDTFFKKYHEEVAGFIVEPIVQGVGGMWFYAASYLNYAKSLCDKYDVLLIFDEIATGFGRTGKMFALEHCDIEPDIICLGKGLTGGYMSLAATVTNEEVAATVSYGPSGRLMHGPTFMANPLACAAAIGSLELLAEGKWFGQVKNLESWLRNHLAKCEVIPGVKAVRVLGAIGVVELESHNINVEKFQEYFVNWGLWLRPFGRMIYMMPPYIMQEDEIKLLADGIHKILDNHYEDITYLS